MDVNTIAAMLLFVAEALGDYAVNDLPVVIETPAEKIHEMCLGLPNQ